MTLPHLPLLFKENPTPNYLGNPNTEPTNLWSHKGAGQVYRAMTRQPWRKKLPNNYASLNQATDPDNCVSV